MITFKSQCAQLTSAAIMLGMVLGLLSLIWPVIIALFVGALLLVRSCNAEQETAVLSWSEIDHVPMIFTS